MKRIFLVALISFFVSCTNASPGRFAGSTPAGTSVREFLEIPLSDSVDFIRWKLEINGSTYSLECNYGIGQPNTPGFHGGGKFIRLSGRVQEEKDFMVLTNHVKTLWFFRINESLLHPADGNGDLMKGTGGFSYTLSKENGQLSASANLKTNRPLVGDSLVFIGRTPCPELDNSPDCKRKKWLLTIYTKSGFFRTGNMKYPGPKGSWKIVRDSKGRDVYQLTADTGESYRLLPIDDHIIVFLDNQDRLLVGDKNFSYTLSRL